MEPEPYDPQAAAAVESGMEEAAMSAAGESWDPMMAAITPMVAAAGDPSEEALRDEQEQTVEEAEKRIAQLEGMVAEMMMDAVTDEVFATSSVSEVVVEDAKVPRFASVTGEFVELSGLMARLAAMGEPEPGTDLEDRLQAVVERLDKLEGTISELMDSKVEDDSLPEEMDDEAEEPGTLVDETKPEAKTAAYYTNARGVRVWHDPSTGKFAPSGFISPKILAKLWKGDSSARRDLMKSVQDARSADPGLNLDGAVAKVLGPRPSDRTKALHWDAGKRSIGSGWGATKPKSKPMLKSDKMSSQLPWSGRFDEPNSIGKYIDEQLQRDEAMRQELESDDDEPMRRNTERPSFLPESATYDDMGDDWQISSWTNGRGSANLNLSYEPTTDEYYLSRASMDPMPGSGVGRRARGVETVSGKFEPGTPMKVIADALVAKGKFGSDAKMPEGPMLKSDALKDDITESLERLMGGAGSVDSEAFDAAMAAYEPGPGRGLPQIPYPDGVLSDPDQRQRERQVPAADAAVAMLSLEAQGLRALADDPNVSTKTSVGPSVLRSWADTADKMAKRLVENLAVTPMASARRNEIETDMRSLVDEMGKAEGNFDRPSSVVAVQKAVDKLSPGSAMPLPWVLFHDRSNAAGELPPLELDPAEAERLRGLDELNRRLVEGIDARLLKSNQMAEGPSVVPMDGQMANTALKQIGTMNVMAISGGRRRIFSDGTLDLPVAKGYHVNIALMADDTYRVQRVYGVGNVKGERTGVLAEQLGEVAYQASNFSDGPFGDPVGSTPMLQSNAMRTENVTMTPEMMREMGDNYGGLIPPAAESAASDANLVLPSALDTWGVDRNDPAAVAAAWDELFSDQYYDMTFVRLDADALAKARAEYGPSDLAGGDGSLLKSNAMKVPTTNGTRDVKLVEVPLTGPDDPFIYRKQFDVVDNATGQVIGRTRQDATGAWSGDTEVLTDNSGNSISVQNQYDRRGDALRMMIEQFDAESGGDGPVLKSNQMRSDSMTAESLPVGSSVSWGPTPMTKTEDGTWEAETFIPNVGRQKRKPTMKGVNNFLVRSQAVGPKERPGRIRIPGEGPVLKSNAMKADTPDRPLAEMPEGTELSDGTTTWTKGADGNWSGETFGGAAGMRADKIDNDALQAKFDRASAMRGYTVAEARGYTDNYLLDLIRQTESPVLRAEAKRRGLL
jgi:hypothetical protein